MNKTARALIPLTIYCIILAMAYFALIWLEIPPSVKLVLRYLPYAFFAMGILFGWWFNRSRVFFCSLTLLLCKLVLLDYVPYGMDSSAYHDMALSIVSVYLPLNILVFSILRERGIISSRGRMRLLFVFIEALIGAWIVWYNDTDLLQLFDMGLFPEDMALPTELPHISILLYAAVLIYLFIRQSATGKNNDAPFMGVAVYSLAALVLSKDAYTAAVMFSLSGLLLVAVVLLASHSMAYLDELTGLPSRRALKEEFMKLGGRYTIAVLDIDHFKKFNDTHGHDVGDEVLKLVASCIKGVGGGGKAFRYGGEEFTIVFPGKTLNEALPYLEELREYIANRGFIKRSKNRPKKKPAEIVAKNGSYKKLHLTVSIGAAEKSEKYKNPEEVSVAADKALYRAKANGRNCVCK